MKRRIWAEHRRDDGGAALIIALIIVTVVAISLGALLTLADTSIRATVNLRAEASTAYEADGALQAAVNNIRNSTVNGQSGQTCFNGNNTLQLNNFNGNDSAAVTCSFDPASVEIQCASLTQCNRPGSAILTLGKVAGEDGINITQPAAGSNFQVHGTVFSNSNINVVKGGLATNTAVYARGACAGTIQSVPPPPSCNYGTTANVLGNDPGYQPATTTVPVHQPLPKCTTSNSVVTFQPGYYDDAVGLSSMMAGNSSCKGSTWWFTPGTYYFDFHNGGTDPNPGLTGGSDVWTVNDGYLVAGTPTDNTGKIIARPPNPASIPGACDNPINDAKAVGVQFIFGGDSQFAIKSGQAEICGTYSASAPPVAVYGLKTGTATSVPATVVATGVTATNFTNATPASLATTDGQYAILDNTSNNKQSSGSVTGSGFGSIPAGSILKSATIRVVHSNTQGSKNDTRTLQFTASDNTTISLTPSSPNDNSTATDTFPVTTQLAKSVEDGTFNSGQLTYSVNMKNKSIEQLDSMQFILTYEPPTFRAEDGCITTMPYPVNGSCPLILAQNNTGNLFYVQGTTYAPNAAMDLTLNNITTEIFRFGVIARSLWVKETGAFSYTGPVIEVPDDTPGFVFSIFLSAYVCPGKPTCAVPPPTTPPTLPNVSARVAFVDGDPTNPSPGHRQVSVLSWSGAR